MRLKREELAGLSLGQSRAAVTFFPQFPFLQKVNPLEAFQYIALR
jgi:hypothetical protein